MSTKSDRSTKSDKSKVQQISMTPNGPKFSRLVQGYWRMSAWQRSTQEQLRFINQHLELGITTVDHAHVYGNPSCETLFGNALKLQPSLREQLQIVTKCGIELTSSPNKNAEVNHYDTSIDSVLNSVDLSLSRLGIDCIDALLIHRPDYLMEVEELAQAFEQLRNSGKVRYFGVSNFTPSQFTLLQNGLAQPLVTNQVEINTLNMCALEDGTLDQLQSLKIRPMAWSCLAGGRFFTEDSEQILRLRSVLTAVANELGSYSIEQLLLAWVLRLPSQPLPILGSGKIERLRHATQALEVELSREQWYRIWCAAKGHEVP